MISVHPYLFFGIVNLTIILAAACGVLYWKWRRAAGRYGVVEAHWEAARDGTEATIAALQTGLGEGARRRVAGLKALQAIFGPDPCTGSAAWKTASSLIVAVVSDMEGYSSAEGLSDQPFDVEDDVAPEEAETETANRRRLQEQAARSAEQDRESARGLGDMERLVGDQSKELVELARYKSAVVDLSQKLDRINSANHKLLAYLRTVSSDEKFKTLHQMVEKLHHGGQELETMVSELETEKQELEPRVKALTQQNESLLNSLKSQRRQLEKAILDKADLRATIEEQEKRIAMRNKSYDRLHKKFDALRREYLTLYELATKGGKTLNA